MPLRLPRDANPEHLRNQARSLHRAAHDGDAAALARVRAHAPARRGGSDTFGLRQVQQGLAREYGFSSWQKLLAHVELTGSDAAARLRRAIDADDVPTVRALVAAEPALLTAGLGYDGGGALTWAAECRGPATPPGADRLAIAQALIDAGADANEMSGSPMLRASLHDGRIPMMDLLVRNGADVNAVWKDYGPILFGPCETLAPAAIAWLLAHGADPQADMAGGRYVGDALSMVLCTYDRSPRRHACVEALVQGGARYEDGPVMDVHRGRLDRLAERLDADPRLATARFNFRRGQEHGGLYGGAPLSGFTLLHLCAEYGELEAARLLLARGADVDARCDGVPNEGRHTGWGDHTPVYHAVTANHNCAFEVLRLLLAAGARTDLTATVHVPTDDGRVTLAEVTPLDYARDYPNPYQPGPGSAPKTEIDTVPHGNVVALLGG